MHMLHYRFLWFSLVATIVLKKKIKYLILVSIIPLFNTNSLGKLNLLLTAYLRNWLFFNMTQRKIKTKFIFHLTYDFFRIEKKTKHYKSKIAVRYKL